MDKIEIAGLSKRQLSRLKNKRPVRCIKAPCPSISGKGHIVLMDKKSVKNVCLLLRKAKELIYN